MKVKENVRTSYHSVLAGPGRIDELDFEIPADPIDIPVPPNLERKCVGYSADFIGPAVVGTAPGLRLNLVGRATGDVDQPATCFPTG
jgi:hypothetical protein